MRATPTKQAFSILLWGDSISPLSLTTNPCAVGPIGQKAVSQSVSVKNYRTGSRVHVSPASANLRGCLSAPHRTTAESTVSHSPTCSKNRSVEVQRGLLPGSAHEGRGFTSHMNLTSARRVVALLVDTFTSGKVCYRSGPRVTGCKRGTRKPGARRRPEDGLASRRGWSQRHGIGLTARRDGTSFLFATPTCASSRRFFAPVKAGAVFWGVHA